MSQNIWQLCGGEKNIIRLETTAWRLVESQQITSTRKLVDSLHEQEILEDLIESLKPPMIEESELLHPLLYTAFRYPPLKHGSRFASRFERSLWYGSLEVEAAMAEKAYYQFNFLRASDGDFGFVETPLTAFSTLVNTDHGLRLTAMPFDNFTNIISSPISYNASQELGSHMRQHGVEAFCYYSARDPGKGVNIGLFSPKAFQRKSPSPNSMQTWRCVATKQEVEFVQVSVVQNARFNFPLATFLIDEVLPFPAI